DPARSPLMDHAAANFPILTVHVILPVVGAVADAMVSRRQRGLAKLIAIISTVATAAMSLWLLASFETGPVAVSASGFQFVTKHAWIDRWGISWHLGVDGISLLLVVLTAILFPLAI